MGTDLWVYIREHLWGGAADIVPLYHILVHRVLPLQDFDPSLKSVLGLHHRNPGEHAGFTTSAQLLRFPHGSLQEAHAPYAAAGRL